MNLTSTFLHTWRPHPGSRAPPSGRHHPFTSVLSPPLPPLLELQAISHSLSCAWRCWVRHTQVSPPENRPALMLPLSLHHHFSFSFHLQHSLCQHITLLRDASGSVKGDTGLIPRTSPVPVVEGTSRTVTSFFLGIKHLKDWSVFVTPVLVSTCFLRPPTPTAAPPLPPRVLCLWPW